jgi:acetylornithine deacetylase
VRDGDLLDLHRRLVAIPSVSHAEGPIADFVQAWLEERGADVERVGDNVIARAGSGPRLLLCSHLDTVSPTAAWTRDPHDAALEDGKVFGLGSNDAKASVAGMMWTFVRALRANGPCELLLMLVPEEETGGRGAEVAWPHVRSQGFIPLGAVIGEPTGLDVATTQKGLLVLELACDGDACHSANAAKLGARNAIYALAHDLVALEGVDLGAPHQDLGPTTLEPTVLRAGERRNVLPDRAAAWLDVRTVPGMSHGEITAAVRRAVKGHVRVHSDRLVPVASDPRAPVVVAAKRARPTARVYGSRTMSDMVWFADVPVIKCGPGATERSHTPDEWVSVVEIEEGAAFYAALVDAFAEVAS